MMSCIPGFRFRPALLDLVTWAETEPDSDEAHFLGQLRAAIAGHGEDFASLLPRQEGRRPGLRLIHSVE